jgi:hypothetical protein
MKKILSLAALSVLASSLPAYANDQEPQLPDVLLNFYLSGDNRQHQESIGMPVWDI